MFGILVLLGLCHLAPLLHLRQYHYVDEDKNWFNAREYCRQKHTDLAMVNSEKDLDELAGLMDDEDVFLGLYKSWGWSLSDADDHKEGEPGFWNWQPNESEKANSSHDCGSIGEAGKWFATKCSDNLIFFCYDGTTSDLSARFILVNISMNWLAAQAHCRQQHTDLARVRNQLENTVLQSMVGDRQVWIGLTRASWVWSDGSKPSFLPWRSPDGHGNCAMLEVNKEPLGMTDQRCDEELPFFCYTAAPVPMKKRVVKLAFTSDSVDLENPAVRNSILKWVERKLGDGGTTKDLKLSWKKFPKKEKNEEQEQTDVVVQEKVCVL